MAWTPETVKAQGVLLHSCFPDNDVLPLGYLRQEEEIAWRVVGCDKLIVQSFKSLILRWT